MRRGGVEEKDKFGSGEKTSGPKAIPKVRSIRQDTFSSGVLAGTANSALPMKLNYLIKYDK